MRFSLRIFLGSITILAVAMVLLATRSENQRKAVKKLKDRGATVFFDDESMPLETDDGGVVNSSDSLGWNCWHTATSVWISCKNYDEKLIAEIRRLGQLKYILVYDCETKSDVRQIAKDFPDATVLDTDAMREELERGGISKRVEKRRQTTQ